VEGRDRLGATNSKGLARIMVDPGFSGLQLMIGSPYLPGDPAGEANTRELTADEWRQLYSRHTLVRWSPSVR
jgi:hypothetical protein